jgi:hypothetical protein
MTMPGLFWMNILALSMNALIGSMSGSNRENEPDEYTVTNKSGLVFWQYELDKMWALSEERSVPFA